MLHLAFIAVVVAFFAIATVFVAGCVRLIGRSLLPNGGSQGYRFVSG